MFSKILGWLSGGIGAVAEPVIGYFQSKMELKAQKDKQKLEIEQALHLARIENVKQGKINEATWNLRSIENSGWKDEWMTIVLSIPLLGVFFGDKAVQVFVDGFNALRETPDWYQWAISIMIASSFGYQKFADFLNRKKYS